MKTLNLLLFLFVLNVSFAQISRSFYTNYSVSDMRYASGIVDEEDGKTRFFSIRDSKTDTLVVVTGILDDEGETSSYETFEFMNLIGSDAIVLSGVVKTNEGAELLIQSGSTSTAFHYFSYSSVNGMTLLHSTPSEYGKVIFRSQAKQDSHVVYAVSNIDGLVRLSSKLGAPSNFSIEVIDDQATTSGNLANPRMGSKFLIASDSSEYCWFKSSLIKRNESGEYSNVALNDFGLSFIYGCGMSFDPAGNIALISGNNYNHVSTNLTLLSSGQIANYNLNNSGSGIMYLEGDQYVLFAYQNGANPAVYEQVIINSDFTLNSKNRFTSRGWNPEFSIKNDSETKIIGRVRQFSNRLSLSFHSSESLLLPFSDFSEFTRTFNNGTIATDIQHLNNPFRNGISNTAGFRKVQEGGEASLIFSMSSACLGLTQDSITRGIFSVFSPGEEIVTGPATNSNFYDHAIADYYNRGFYVTREMIDNHILNVSDPNYEIPFAIKYWPAHGTDGQAEKLAQFYDFNNNGQYEPELGDYPSIYGDQCLLYIFHNDLDIDPSGMECHQYFYSFQCDTSEVLNNSIFLNQRFFARNEVLMDVHTGNMIDYDIGFSGDDYIGTNVELGLTYGYNGDNIDENGNGTLGFQDSLVAMGTVFLRGPKLNADSIDNLLGIGSNQTINGYGFDDGIIDNEAYTLEYSLSVSSQSPAALADPTNSTEAYNVFQGINVSGLAQQVNGVDVRYAYFGTSDSLFYGSNGIDHGNDFSEISEGSTPGDRRMYMGTGKTTLEPDDSSMVELVTAFVSTSGDAVTTPQQSVDELFTMVETLKNQYASNQGGCDVNFDPYVSPNMPDLGVHEIDFSANLYPNPTNDIVTVSSNSLIEKVEIYGLNGSLLKRVQFNSTKKSFSVSELNNGVYLIRLTSNGVDRVLRLIKN